MGKKIGTAPGLPFWFSFSGMDPDQKMKEERVVKWKLKMYFILFGFGYDGKGIKKEACVAEMI